MTTDLDLDAIERRANDATPGPWHSAADPSVWSGSMQIAQLPSYGEGSGASGLGVGPGTSRSTAEFIAHAREDVPALVEALRDGLAETGRLRLLVDQEITFRDLEVKIRDGSFNLRAVGGEEGGNPVYKLVVAMLLHMLLGDENEMPPNYRSFEFAIRPAGEADEIRCCAEILTPGGKTSHEIRRDLEATVAKLEAAVDEELGNRDRNEEWADRLAYSIAPQSVIGEHSSGNNPWQNALEQAELRQVHTSEVEDALQQLIDGVLACEGEVPIQLVLAATAMKGHLAHG